MVGSSFKDFIDREYLPLSALRLELLPEMIPKLGLGDNLIASKESNSIDLRIGIIFSG